MQVWSHYNVLLLCLQKRDMPNLKLLVMPQEENHQQFAHNFRIVLLIVISKLATNIIDIILTFIYSTFHAKPPAMFVNNCLLVVSCKSLFCFYNFKENERKRKIPRTLLKLIFLRMILIVT